MLLVAAQAQACELTPGGGAGPKAPGDNFYRLIVNGEIERYAPGERYVGQYRHFLQPCSLYPNDDDTLSLFESLVVNFLKIDLKRILC